MTDEQLTELACLGYEAFNDIARASPRDFREQTTSQQKGWIAAVAAILDAALAPEPGVAGETEEQSERRTVPPETMLRHMRHKTAQWAVAEIDRLRAELQHRTAANEIGERLDELAGRIEEKVKPAEPVSQLDFTYPFCPVMETGRWSCEKSNESAMPKQDDEDTAVAKAMQDKRLVPVDLYLQYEDDDDTDPRCSLTTDATGRRVRFVEAGLVVFCDYYTRTSGETRSVSLLADGSLVSGGGLVLTGSTLRAGRLMRKAAAGQGTETYRSTSSRPNSEEVPPQARPLEAKGP